MKKYILLFGCLLAQTHITATLPKIPATTAKVLKISALCAAALATHYYIAHPLHKMANRYWHTSTDKTAESYNTISKAYYFSTGIACCALAWAVKIFFENNKPPQSVIRNV